MRGGGDCWVTPFRPSTRRCACEPGKGSFPSTQIAGTFPLHLKMGQEGTVGPLRVTTFMQGWQRNLSKPASRISQYRASNQPTCSASQYRADREAGGVTSCALGSASVAQPPAAPPLPCHHQIQRPSMRMTQGGAGGGHLLCAGQGERCPAAARRHSRLKVRVHGRQHRQHLRSKNLFEKQGSGS